MIVLDAAAAVSALVDDGPAREALRRGRPHAIHLVDSEVASTLRRAVLGGRLTSEQRADQLQGWMRLLVMRHPTRPLLPRIWELRENLSAYDAGHVALAERLRCALVTADVRIAGAPGIRCAVTVVPA